MAYCADKGCEYHTKQLKNYCRVCARGLTGYKHLCKENSSTMKVFGIDTASDSPAIHPEFYCHVCHNTARRLSQNTGAETSLQVHTWAAHTEGQSCEVCIGKGGRPRKKSTKSGRPAQNSSKGIINSILRNAPQSMRASLPLSPSRFLSHSSLLSSLQCGICKCIVDRPVEAPCHKLICAECICESMRSSDLTGASPCCKKQHDIHSESFTPASELTVQFLQSLLLHCDEPCCPAVVELKYLKEHVAGGCKSNQVSPSKLTIGQVMARPLQSPPTATEKRAAANVVRRLIHSSPATSSSCVVRLPTEGKVSVF